MICLHNFDLYVLSFIQKNMHNYLMDRFMVCMTQLGNGGLIWIIISILLMLNKKYRKVGLISLMALMLVTILGEGIIKHIARRERPFTHVEHMKLLIPRPSSYSFPSGHTGAAFAAATVLAKYFKKYSIGIFALAALIAFSRMYLYVHYPTDVIAGMCLGTVSGVVAIYVSNKYVFTNTRNKIRNDKV